MSLPRFARDSPPGRVAKDDIIAMPTKSTTTALIISSR